LATCIITVKMCRNGENLKNTFGWMRIHVCGAVASVCFLAALCFSVTVECLQTMFHLSHHEKMHYPEVVGVVGLIGLVVNAICFAILGGYTFHQSSFIGSSHYREDLVISASVQSYVKKGVRERKNRSVLETFRDFFGTVLVIVCSLVIYFWENALSDFFDPLVTLFAVVVLIVLSYSYAKDACHILLLTIPAHIDVKTIMKELQENFPEICDIHEFHVWQLTPARIISSAHIVLQDAEGYLAMQHNVIDFLHNKGISHVTLQPEFVNLFSSDKNTVTRRRKCFLPCGEEECEDKQCCVSQSDCEHSHAHGHSHQSAHSRESNNDHQTNLMDNTTHKLQLQEPEIDENDEELEPELQPMIQSNIKL